MHITRMVLSFECRCKSQDSPVVGHELLDGDKSLVADIAVVAVHHQTHHGRLGTRRFHNLLAAWVAAHVLANVMSSDSQDLDKGTNTQK